MGSILSEIDILLLMFAINLSHSNLTLSMKINVSFLCLIVYHVCKLVYYHVHSDKI